MKSVREILLEHHRGAIPALDEIRVDAVHAMARQNTATDRRESLTVGSVVAIVWQELFVSCRRYWMALATAWCVIGFLTILGAREDATSRSLAGNASQLAVQAVEAQLRLRAELLGEAVVQEARADRAEPTLGPRSAREPDVANV
jgi:hypothetical protein